MMKEEEMAKFDKFDGGFHVNKVMNKIEIYDKYE